MNTDGIRIVVLSLSRIARDRRVMRQCETLHQMGITPTVVGYAEPGDNLEFPFVHRQPPRPTLPHRLGTVVRQVPAWLGDGLARAGFWAAPTHRWALEAIHDARATHIIANDWPSLAIAVEAKKSTGARILYDTHEFATLEFDERRYWRLVYKPFVAALERASILGADVISTVGPHLARALQDKYGLVDQPLVIRNTPEWVDAPDTATGWPLRILYHGNLLPDRGLEQLIDSISLWRENHRLIIRGAARADYLSSLRARAIRLAVADRILFEPPVLPSEVVRIASQTADVGVHFTPLDTVQRHFSLPNKFFEYVIAGLAIVVTPAQDLAALVHRYDLGIVSRDSSPRSIADAINGLSAENVGYFRGRARTASRELSWDQERRHFLSAVDRLLSATVTKRR